MFLWESAGWLAEKTRYTTAGLLSSVRELSRHIVLASFGSNCAGTLRIQDGGREEMVIGKGKLGGPTASIVVHSDVFWVRVFLSGDMGFAQSYMLGEISTSNLTEVFEFFIGNASNISSTTSYGAMHIAYRLVQAVGRSLNHLENAKLNANAHYSLSNDMFAAFLSPDMTYSSPLWLPTSDPRAASETLEQAQRRKLQYAVSATHIKSTDHVLEIGTGWGSFAIQAVRATGCRVTTVTASRAQKKLVDQKIAEEGLSDRIQVVLADYRELRPAEPFDKIVSIEMIEHVGHDFLDTYFACMDRYLKKDGGIAYFQCITIPERRYAGYRAGEDFIRKYIFPGGHLPTASGLVGSIDRGSDGRLIVEEIKAFGGHYSKALRCWRRNFLANFDSQIAPSMRETYPSMSAADLDVFKRKWEYYFSYCEAGFKTKTLGDVGITVAREGCIELLEEIP